jgi:hypothetical protein
MDHVWVRKVEKRDVAELGQWLNETPDNLFDPAPFFYPLTTTDVAFKRDKKIGFMPAQQVMMLESLAFNPASTERERAIALSELMKSAIAHARDKQVKEIYFVCKDDSTAEFAKRHLFEELKHRTFRLKIDSLESPLPG